MTTYTLRKASPSSTKSDVVVVGIARDKTGALVVCPGGEDVASAYGKKLAPLLSSMAFDATPGEVLRVPTNGTLKAPTLLAVGLGAREELTTEKVRRAAGVAARSIGNAATVAVALPAVDAAHVRAVADGFISGLYSFTRYKSSASDSKVAEVAVLTPVARSKDAVAALKTAETVGEMVRFTRDWVNTPPNDFTPELFADAVSALTKQRKRSGLKIEVLDTAALQEKGCGGILGVGQGSAHGPRLVKLTWKPKGAKRHVALVGKGITYDSGGLTIKPGTGMTTMKCDMAGAAGVVAAFHAIAALEIPVAVTAYAPMAENMPSGSAYRPGDVLTMYGGKTVEVTNTDAEGRLVLADALTMASELEPDAIIEMSTLTGACVVALGDRVAGVFGTDDPVAEVIEAAGSVGELVWPMPIPEHTSETVRTESKVADVLQHNWVRWGGAMYAAAFLKEFTGGLPFAHLDIAGPAFNSGKPWGQMPAGGTGFGVATIVEYVDRLAR